MNTSDKNSFIEMVYLYLKPKMRYCFARLCLDHYCVMLIYKVRTRNALKYSRNITETLHLSYIIENRNIRYRFLSFLTRVYIYPEDWLKRYFFKTELFKSRLKKLQESEIQNNLLRLTIVKQQQEINVLKSELSDLKRIINEAQIDWHGGPKQLVEFFALNKLKHINSNPAIKYAKTSNIVNAIQLIFKPEGKMDSQFNQDTIEKYLRPSLYS